MPSRSAGLAILAFTVLLLLIITSISLATAGRVLFDVSTMTRFADYREVNEKVEENLARYISEIAANHSVSAAYTEQMDQTLFEVNSTYVNTPLSNKYKGIYSLESVARPTNSSHPLAKQTVALAEFSLITNLPTKNINYAQTESQSSLLSGLTNKSIDVLSTIQRFATFYAAHCDSLTEKSYGVILIEGNCRLDNIALGSADRPEVLAVINSNIELANSSVYGLVLHLCDINTHTSTQFNVSSSMRIYGAVFTTCDEKPNASSVSYQPQVLKNWIAHRDNLFLEVVTGSWYYE